jgi:hypothetical protein
MSIRRVPSNYIPLLVAYLNDSGHFYMAIEKKAVLCVS